MNSKKKLNIFDIVKNKESKLKKTSKGSNKTKKIIKSITILAEADSENYEKIVKNLLK